MSLSFALTFFAACTRRIIQERLLDLNLEELPLPIGVSASDKHVPILVSKDLSTKKHVIVLFPERHIDAGIFSYRVIGDEGLNVGSAVNFVKSILDGPQVTTHDGKSDANTPPLMPDTPGLVIANPSQLIWYRGGGRPVTDREWTCLPRPTAAHEAMRIDEVKNRIEGNKNFREHVQYMFEHVLTSISETNICHPEPNSERKPICHPEAKFSIIGQEYVGSEALQYIINHWVAGGPVSWRNRINCVALVNPQHSLEELFTGPYSTLPKEVTWRNDITNFMSRRVRAYRLSLRPLETLLSGRRRLGCNLYSAGETQYEESCFIRCWPSILDWVEMCRVSDTYAEPVFEYGESDNEEDDGPKSQISRKPLTEAEQEKVRFHGNIHVAENGKMEKASEQ